MFMTLAVLVVIAILTFMWSTRGFLSALIHMFCVILAGAVAFAVWEPLSYFVLENAPTGGRSFFTFLRGQAWALGLALPFAAFLAVVRPVLDQLIPANAQPTTGVEYAGAGVCGLITGVITSGILVLAAGTMRFSSDFMGYRPVDYSGQSVQRVGGLLIPVDKVVGRLYSFTSTAAFSTREPLAEWYPDVTHPAATMRLTHDEGKADNVALPGSFSIVGSYVIGGDGSLNTDQLLSDPLDPTRHQATDLDGNPYSGAHKLVGVWIKPADAMKEKNGQVVFGEGQLWMLSEHPETGERTIRHPVAVLSPLDGASEQYARFRFSAPRTFLATPGAAIREIAFEFVIPAGHQPKAVYFKGIREVLSGAPAEATIASRNAALARPRFDLRAIGGGAGAGVTGSALKTAGAIKVDTSRSQPQTELSAAGISLSNALPLRILIQKGTHGGLELNDDNQIVGGSNIFPPSAVQGRGLDRALRVNQFASANAMVQVEVTQGKPASLISPLVAQADRSLPPVLIDANGRQIPAVGYVYRDRDRVVVRYQPSDPLGGIDDLQADGISLSISNPTAELVLIFEFSSGAQLKGFAIGGQLVLDLSDPVVVNARRR